MYIIKYVNNQMELDLIEVFKLLLRKAWIIMLSGVVCGVFSLLCTFLFVKPIYTASISLYVENTNNMSDKYNITTSDLSASIMLIQTYATIIKSETMLDKIIKISGVNYDVEVLSEMINAGSIDNTGILVVQVSGNNPDESALIANAIAEVVPEELPKIVLGSSVKVLSSARVPNARSSPSYSKSIMFGTVLGVLFASIGIVLLATMDTKMKTVDDLKKWGYTVLGKIPVSTANINGRSSYTNIIANRAAATKAYDNLTRNVVFSFSGSMKKTILFTGSTVDCEKSIICFNLAKNLADNGNRVLIMDGNLRIPHLSNLLEIKESPGLSDVLVDLISVEKSIRHLEEKLDVITVGTIAPNPLELLSAQDMEKLMNKLNCIYDYILIDSAQIDLKEDVIALAKYVTGFVLIEKKGRTKRSKLEKNVSDLKAANARMLGVVVVSEY
ncbi:MAG: polysaccharide biosynthesis tyrosine autokinase [Lachnospiraceae bacterium]|nr:polysaccharide biosynthesis tyrosine autokinase [Lachnospiraceae bacterium]